jgi:hypothetical protein
MNFLTKTLKVSYKIVIKKKFIKTLAKMQRLPNSNNSNEDQNKLKDLWKTYGLHTEAGRMLFKSYSRGKKTNINYPKPKQKKWKKPNDRNMLVKKAQRKGCPQ